MRKQVLFQAFPGQSLTEYALIGALVSLVGIGAVALLGQSISGEFQRQIPAQAPAASSQLTSPPGS
ncbi:MAG TPA: hypothetical protein V6C52_07520 [Coleofasciculaceae cyanobacterium]|jgi:Flp pilus assembly pilin Flp